MATPKKGSRPIKITLTENQLSDIISQTARTRKGLKAESLEDRIAPSMIGAPIDPSLVPLPDSGTDPIAPTTDGTYGDPEVNVSGTPYDPFLPPPDPSNPPLPGQPLPTGYDPTVTPTFVQPQFPGGFGMQYGPNAGPTAPFIAPDPNAPPPPPSPFQGSGAPTNTGGLFGGQTGGFGQFDPNTPPNLVDPNNPGVPLDQQPFVPSENPADLLQEGDAPFVPPTDPGIPDDGKVLPTEPTDGGPIVPGEPSPEGPAPSAEELQNHRQNILRQLRGQ